MDLKQPRDLAATVSWGSLFQFGIVLGNNDMSVVSYRGGVVAVCVVLSVAQSVFCWLW